MKLVFSLFCAVLITASSFAHNDVTFKFTQNIGQYDSNVLFHNKLHIGDMFLEKDRFTFSLWDPNQLDDFYKKRHGIGASGKSGNGGDHNNPVIGSRDYSDNEDELTRMHAYSMIFEGANVNTLVSAEDILPAYYNYAFGNDKSKWVTKANSYRLVKYDQLYDGIDMEIYTSFKNMKYEFMVSPGADPYKIKVNYEGVESVSIMENGYLLIKLSNGEIKEMNPYSYQEVDGQRVEVPCNFNLNGTELTFEFPNGFDPTKQLVIDPTWIFSTLSGSTADNWGFTATYDSQGNLYVAGIAFAAGYPTTVGAYSTGFLGGAFDIAVHKYDPTGATLLYGTYLGGTDAENPNSMVCDSNDNLIMLNTTGSLNYPTTVGAYDQTFNGGFAGTAANMWGYTFVNGTDIAITKLDVSGAIIASTLIGGSDNEGLNESMVYNYADQSRGEVVIDANQDIYVTSSLWSTDFPVTDGSLMNQGAGAVAQDGVLFKMSADLSTLSWATFVGGTAFDTGYSVRIRGSYVYTTGGTTSTDIGNTAGALDATFNGVWDGYIARFDISTGAHQQKTYIGTASYDQGFILETDDAGDVYVAGQTVGSYPVVSAAYSDAFSGQFIHKLDANLTSTVYSTTFGSDRPSAGSAVDISLTALLVDNCGNVYVSGWGGGFNSASSTGSYNPQAGTGTTTNLPVTFDAQQSTTDGADFYFFVMDRNATGLLYATFLGDNGTAEHTDGGTSRFDPNGVVYQSVCAACNTGNFPTTPGVYSPTSGTAGTPFFCNVGGIKFEFDFQGVEASALDPGDQILCNTPYNVSFNESSGAPQHYWDFGDGSGTSTSANPMYTYADSGTYNVMYIAIDPASCNLRDTAYFDVTLIRPEVFSASLNVPPIDPCNAPDSLEVNLAFTGTGTDSLIWNMGDGTQYIDSLTVDHFYTSQGTYYIEMIAYDFICNQIDTIYDTVVYIANYTAVAATAPPDQLFCSAPFNVNFNGDAVPNHYWDFGDGLGTSVVQNPMYTYADTGSYTVMYVAIDSNTCNIADTVYFNIGLDQAETFSATLNVPPIDPCNAPDSLLVTLAFTGSGADSLQWDMGDGTVYTDSLNINHFYTSQGVYYIELIAWDLVCNNVDTILDTVNYVANFTSVSATAPPDQELCFAPFNVNFSGDAVPNHYWDFGDGLGTSTNQNPMYTYADSGSYQVMYVAIDSSTCNIADTVYFNVGLTVAETLSADFNFPTVEPCTSPDSILVNLNFTGTGADSLFWDMGDGTTFIDSLAVNYYYTSQGVYPITLSAWDFTCGQFVTFTDTLDFTTSFSTAVADASPNILACDPPFDVTFSGGSPAPPISSWDFDDGFTSAVNSPTHTFADTGHFDIMYVAIDSSTCNIADTVWLTVDILEAEQFSATLDFDPPPPCGGDTMWVDLAFTGTGADYLSWDMGDGTVFVGDTVINYYYTVPGVYNVSLYAEDTTCNKSETVNNTVVFGGNPQSSVVVPNVFTPNGDGYNDIIRFSGVDPSAEFTWTIYNRWGVPVFLSVIAGRGWDGVNIRNGKELESGIYFYELIFKDVCENEDKLVTGYIHLNR